MMCPVMSYMGLVYLNNYSNSFFVLFGVDFAMSNRSIRAYDPPSGQTPGKPPKQRPKVEAPSSRKTLFQSGLKPSVSSDFAVFNHNLLYS